MFLLIEKHFYIYSCLSCLFPFIINKPYIGDNIGLSMKILLSMVICSQVAGTCMEPFPWPTTFDTQYNCLMEGYKQSIVKMEENEVSSSLSYQQSTIAWSGKLGSRNNTKCIRLHEHYSTSYASVPDKIFR